eukprot:TRINITY_DN62587_c0_g1_i1.p1 TRINITY_DN62587_c0_g1~~TRINITY_DN62587_c0_g1_i1.p1  ORF type:complete len:440 (+),score=44.13 TRINITY_DN62587_c0_g1_i1:119-1321(+)
MIGFVVIAVIVVIVDTAVLLRSPRMDSHWLRDFPLIDAANSPYVSVSGRFVVDGPALLFDWSGVEVTASLQGSLFGIVLSDVGNHYDVIVDGGSPRILATTGESQATYILSSGSDDDGIHSVVLIKRTEGVAQPSTRGAVVLHGFKASGGWGPPLWFGANLSTTELAEVDLAKQQHQRRLLFIGDSMTCGLGSLGQDGCDLHDPAMESAPAAFAAQTASAFGAERQLICVSGHGVLRNYGEPRELWGKETVPTLWRLLLGTRIDAGVVEVVPPASASSSWVPHAVVIHLGTNDFLTPGGPSRVEFSAAYHDLIRQVRHVFGVSVPMILACGPMCIHCPVCGYVQEVAQAAGAYFVDLRFEMSSAETGCWAHPSVLGHQRMTATMLPILAKATSWQTLQSR